MNAHFKITLEQNPEENFITGFSPSGITITVDHNNMDPAPFTHELLHLYIKSKQTLLLQDMQQMTDDDHLLLYLFSPSVVSHICNCLEHYKMLPMFLDRGFDIKDFVEDFHQHLMEPQEMKK